MGVPQIRDGVNPFLSACLNCLRRSYAHLSRRQSATPDIPRPRAIRDANWRDGRTFGVIIDTSGSMDCHTLGKALVAIASYAEAKDVPAVRVICCDASPYDMGYLTPLEIAGRLKLQGRGGTVLQPAIDQLHTTTDFPQNGPILIITDGYCEPQLRIRRNHAFLLPQGNRLPFSTPEKVFYFS